MGGNKNNRREFIKVAALSGIGVGMSGSINHLVAPVRGLDVTKKSIWSLDHPDSTGFVPRRAASWWSTIEDLLWPEKNIVDNIKRRCEAFAKAEIDTAINFGFHIRFDFSNYFHQLHGYYKNVCDELHQYNIRFMDHYSCDHMVRPKNKAEFIKVHQWERHHVLLFPDPVAAPYAQYEGHHFNDICEVNIRDGSRGYADKYQLEIFCPNNPGFLDMHKKYLTRLLNEVPLDGMQVDDMCDYAGLVTCGCKYCRERLKGDYGREIPPLSDKNFWGNTANKNTYLWGNYENPAFRDWLRMKSDSYVDHLKMIKSVIGDKPLMTCVSSAGPIILNGLSLNVEKMAPHLDFFMLENVGIDIRCVDWVRMDAEALIQKDIAQKRGTAATLALSYTIYEKGGYLGWSLARFWGAGNWGSTLDGRLIEDPPDAVEIQDIVGRYNHWEKQHSNLDYHEGHDLVEARLVSSLDCRENGWRNNKGREQWNSVQAWSDYFVRNNIGYRFVRVEELADEKALCNETTPLILDNVGCVSDAGWSAIKKYLSLGGTAWISLPFGERDEKGVKRKFPLSRELKNRTYRNLVILPSATVVNPGKTLVGKNKFQPALRQISGDKRWAARIRSYHNGLTIHFLNTGLIAVPHPTIKNLAGRPILKDIRSDITDNRLVYEVDINKISLPELTLISPEWDQEKRNVVVNKISDRISRISINLEDTTIYAIAQPAEI